MVHVACPSCGERGAISAEQVGARIKCRKCGQTFRVSGPGPKAAAVAPQAAPHAPPPSTTLEGIVVEGLDDAWTGAPAAPEVAPAAPTAAVVVESLKPDIYVKGGDYTTKALPEAQVVAAYGGEVRLLPMTPARSTSDIIRAIQSGTRLS